MSNDALAKRRAEDAEHERRRRSKLEHLALDMVAEHYGQADWQRLRSQNPTAFYRSKVEISEAPPGFILDVREPCGPLGDLVFRFDWFVGEWRRHVVNVSARELQRQEEDYGERAADAFLGHAVHGAARQIERDSGAAVSIRIRGNRAAYEEETK